MKAPGKLEGSQLGERAGMAADPRQSAEGAESRREELQGDLREWGMRERAVLGLVEVGRIAQPESQIAVVVLLDDPGVLASDTDWMAHFGSVKRISDDDRGPIRAKRVHYADGKAVVFGFASPEWAATDPCDAATLAVVESGFRILYDPKTLLRNLAIAARPHSPERRVLRSTCGRYARRRLRTINLWLIARPPA